VCRRVLRSEIDREIAERSLGHADFFRFAGTETPSTWICSANAPIGEAYDVWSCLLRGRNDADVDAALPRFDQRKVHRGGLAAHRRARNQRRGRSNATPSGTRERPEHYAFNGLSNRPPFWVARA